MSREASAAGVTPQPDAAALVAAAEWLSGIFMAPMSSQQVEAAGTEPGLQALRWMGSQLEATTAVGVLCGIFEQDDAEATAVSLQRRYTALFEGIFRHRAVLPYESAWRGQGPALGGEAVTEMQALLRRLDLHVSHDCREPADHLAIELAALSAALRGDKHRIAAELVQRLQGWVPAFIEALRRQDPDGFYAAAGELLLAASEAASTASENDQRQGEFA